MKTIYSVIIFCLCVAMSHAQTKKTQEADRYYASYQYTQAIKAYTKLLDKTENDSYVFKQLGNSYYNIFNMDKAAHWYGKAIENGTKDAEVFYRYAQTLKSLGKYKQANTQLDKFAELKPRDSRAKAHLKNPNYIPSLTKNDQDFEVEKLKISKPGYSDFAPLLFHSDRFYFVSTRGNSKKNSEAQPNTDIYRSSFKDNSTFIKPTPVKRLNTKYHDGPISLSADGKTAIFARSGHSGYYKKTKDGKVKVAQQILLKAEKVNGKWTNITKLSINSSKYSVTQPSLSQDGKTLYFTSDMPGGEGDTDIWKVSINGDGFGKPENLGPQVNTPGKEDFPYIEENHILYFSSRGRQGLGGLDIYKKDLSNNEDAQNLGAPINSKYDDFSFTYVKAKDIGFFASNRDGEDNLYKAIPRCHVQAVALVKDEKTGKKLTGAKVEIADNQGNVITSKISDDNGRVAFNVQCETAYEFHISKRKYESKTFAVNKTKEKETIVNAPLKPMEVEVTDKEVKLNNIYFEFDKSNITKRGANELNKLVRVMKNRPEMKILVVAHTDAKGNPTYNKKLSDRRAQATIQYLISKGISEDRLKGKGVGSEDPKIDCQPNCSDEQRAKNRRSEFLIVDSFDKK